MRYSTHAPQELIDRHIKLIEIYGSRDANLLSRVLLLRKLVDAENNLLMEYVWKALAKRSQSPTYGLDFYHYCEMAYGASRSTKKTQAEKTSELMAIAKKSRELVKLIDRTGWLTKTPVFDLFTVERFNAIGSLLKIEKRPSLDDSAFAAGLRQHLPEAPYIEDIIKQVAHLADTKAKEPVLVKKAYAKNANIVAFVRELTKYLRRDYGQPLRMVVANTASVILGEVVTEDFVRQNAK